MGKSYRNVILVLILALMMIGTGIVWGTDRREYLEEQGLGDAASPVKSMNSPQGTLTNTTLLDPVLLIPDSNADNIGMYDPEDGSFLGIYISGYAGFTTPICAIAGPDSNVYVSDQVADAVFVFDPDGNYLFTYVDGSDGLNNIRGIDFRDGHLFVTSGDDYVAEFDGPHSRLPDFINDGSDTFDIMFLEDGRSCVSDIQGTSDNVRLYDREGNLIQVLFAVNFPEQINSDPLMPGDCLNNSFSADVVTDFDLDGNIYETTSWDSGRGVYRLGNGNLLVTNGTGVFEVEPGTGVIIEQENSGSSRFIELYQPGGEVGIGDNTPNIPTGFSVMQNYPNPFNASTTIRYNLTETSNVVIDIYNLLGSKIATLQDGEQSAGQHQVIWDASDVASGTYFYKVQAGDHSQTMKMVLLK
jgi:hypothetical protein